MADQDAQDINQMMSVSPEVVSAPKKSKFIWVVLGCVILGIGLGVVVYQQSLKSTVKPKPTPKSVTTKPSVAPVVTPTPVASPLVAVPPQTNLVTPVANTITFPETGKLRVFSNLNNIQLVLTIATNGQTKNFTIPNKPVNATNAMNYADSTFEVTAGSVGTINAYINSTSGPKMGGWIEAVGGKTCGANSSGTEEMNDELAWAEAHLATGKTMFARQCWADEIDPKDPSSYDFNDFFLVWSYATSAAASSSPVASASVTPTPSASVKASASPSASPSVKASASPSVKASATATPTPTPSPRVVMPDTSEGTPVTGVFEITVGTISVGLLLLVLGLFGLLAL